VLVLAYGHFGLNALQAQNISALVWWVQTVRTFCI